MVRRQWPSDWERNGHEKAHKAQKLDTAAALRLGKGFGGCERGAKTMQNPAVDAYWYRLNSACFGKFALFRLFIRGRAPVNRGVATLPDLSRIRVKLSRLIWLRVEGSHRRTADARQRVPTGRAADARPRKYSGEPARPYLSWVEPLKDRGEPP